MDALNGYRGLDFSSKTKTFLAELSDQDVLVLVTGPANKTIRLIHRTTGRKLGFISDAIKRIDAVYGYHFAGLDLHADGCPTERKAEYLSLFCNRYKYDMRKENSKCIEINIRDELKTSGRKSYFSPCTLELARTVISKDILDAISSVSTNGSGKLRK